MSRLDLRYRIAYTTLFFVLGHAYCVDQPVSEQHKNYLLGLDRFPYLLLILTFGVQTSL